MELNKDNQLLRNTEPSAHSSKKNNPQTRIIFIWMCLQTLLLFFFFDENIKVSTEKKMYKLLSNTASLKTLVGLELHSISQRCVFNVHGKGKWLSSTFQEPLPLQREPVTPEVTSSSPCAHQNCGQNSSWQLLSSTQLPWRQ